MNDTQIERILLSLKPTPPSPELLLRVEQEMELQSLFRTAGAELDSAPALHAKPKRPSWHVPVAWASVGAAAAVTLVMSLMPPREVSPAAYAQQISKTTAVGNAANAAPVSTNRQVLAAEDLGIVYPSAAQPTRQIRVQRMEQRLVIDPATGAQTIIQVPVEEILSIPVQVQ